MTSHKRWALAAAAVFSAGILAGCPPVPPNPATHPTTLAARVAGLPDAPVLGNEPVAKGVYVSVDRRLPLADKTLAKARLTRTQVLATVTPKPESPATQPTPNSAAAPAAESPPEAVKLYLQGRQRFLEGNNSEAMSALEKALQLDPQGFTVLRLMGRVCFAGSQLARGATYLQRAQVLRPRDVEVNYLLGRYWLERNDFDQAAFFFMQAEDSPERLMTSVQTPLASFYLGIALQLGGYHFAAAKEYEHFLELAELPIPGYRYDPELSYLISMQWASHLAAAENFARIGDYQAALPHYKNAAAARPDDPFVGSRLVNALAHTNQMAPAQQAALVLVTLARGSEDAVKLLAWTYQSAGHAPDLVADLRDHLQKTPAKDEAAQQTAAMTLAATQDFIGQKLDAARTLGTFLQQHPHNLEILAQLLKRADSRSAFVEALAASARALAADRENAQAVLRLFLPAADGPGGLAYATHPAPLSQGTPESFAAAYLQALVLQAQDQPPEQIAAAFEASLKAAPDFLPARTAYVAYLLAQEKFAKASAAIEALLKQQPNSPRAWQMQVESEVAQQRLLHALQLAQEARQRFPADTDLRMELITILRLRGEDAVADAETQALLKELPKYEPAYRALVNSLFQRLRRGSAGNNALVSILVATLNRMAAELPDSQFGHVSSAIIYNSSGRPEDAEASLRAVLAVDPDSSDALVTLAQVVTLAGRPTEGTALLESALKRKPQLDVVRGLAALYTDAGHKAEALGLVKKYAEENPDAEGYLELYSAQLAAQDQRPQAIALLAQARTRFPRSQAIALDLARLQESADDFPAALATMQSFIQANGETSDRLYLLSHFYSAAGNDDASVAALQRVLAIMPDHIGANNDLGYFWVNAGIHLEQAEPMIRKALTNKPDDPAFLDSLGWLYYKQGKFPEAAALLQRALSLPGGTSPEVIQHLGDTLYRMGRAPDAVTQWEKALQALTITPHLSPADRKEQTYLTQALAEMKAGRTPALSPILESSKAASQPPATSPLPH